MLQTELAPATVAPTPVGAAGAGDGTFGPKTDFGATEGGMQGAVSRPGATAEP